MTVRLYTLSGMRLPNGGEVPQGCDLDRPYEVPPLEYRFSPAEQAYMDRMRALPDVEPDDRAA